MKPIVPAVEAFAANHWKALMIGGIVSTNVATAVVSGVCTHKADVDIFEKENLEGRILEPKEKVVIYAKHHIPTALTVAGHAVGVTKSVGYLDGQLHAYKTLTTVAEDTLTIFKEAVADEVSEETMERIKGKVTERQVDKSIPDDGVMFFKAREDQNPCIDLLTNQMFCASEAELKAAQNDINAEMLANPYDTWVSENFYLSSLGLKEVPTGWDIGWDLARQGQVEFEIGTTIINGNPVFTVIPTVLPGYKY